MILYGKDALKKRLDSAAEKGRLPHAIMFSGNEGSGRKIMARYTAQLFICKDKACGKCAACRNIENDSHPDVIFVKKACKNDYSSDSFRSVIRDTSVRPNNGDVKVYIFEEADTMRSDLHNVLLKLVEEPAEYLRFVFTCENPRVIPETILSRVTEFEVPDTPVSDCERFLRDNGLPNASELAEAFAGNIGKCLADKDSADMKRILIAQKAAAAVANRDAFSAAAVLSNTSVSNKEQDNKWQDFSAVMGYLSRILCDALSQKYGEPAEFFGKKESGKIASVFSEKEILNMLDACVELEKNESYHINLPLSAAYFTSRIL